MEVVEQGYKISICNGSKYQYATDQEYSMHEKNIEKLDDKYNR